MFRSESPFDGLYAASPVRELQRADITPRYLAEVRRLVRDVINGNVLGDLRTLEGIKDDVDFPREVRDIVKTEFSRGSPVHSTLDSPVPYGYVVGDKYDGVRSSDGHVNAFEK